MKLKFIWKKRVEHLDGKLNNKSSLGEEKKQAL